MLGDLNLSATGIGVLGHSCTTELGQNLRRGRAVDLPPLAKLLGGYGVLATFPKQLNHGSGPGAGKIPPQVLVIDIKRTVLTAQCSRYNSFRLPEQLTATRFAAVPSGNRFTSPS